MARILIVAGGCRGRRLAAEMVSEGHAARITTRVEAGRAAIEDVGAECWIGTPDRLATLRGALESVTIACWLLGTAAGPPDALRALHGSRLELFLTQAIDTTVRGLVYEGAPTTIGPRSSSGREALLGGEQIVRVGAARNAIPLAVLTADPSEPDAWHADARAAVESLLGCG